MVPFSFPLVSLLDFDPFFRSKGKMVIVKKDKKEKNGVHWILHLFIKKESFCF